MRGALLPLALLAAAATATSQRILLPRYFLGAVGANCMDTCLAQSMNCNPAIEGGLVPFQKAGVDCAATVDNWDKEWEPAFNPTTRNCYGANGTIPEAVACQAYNESVARVCRCDPPGKEMVFGTGYSQGVVSPREVTMFAHVLSSAANTHAAMTHFWLTPSQPGVTVRYYVDGETTPSIEFEPDMACGTGWNDDAAPWGNKLFGKGARTGAWFWNFRVPFYQSVKITMSAPTQSVLYTIFRGGVGVPVSVGGVQVLPSTNRVKLYQQRVNAMYQPQDFVDIADVPSGNAGVFFMQTLAVASHNLNFLEGCYHWFDPPTRAWPGVVMSTGTEDYYDSAYYFDGGQFRLPVSGFTHLKQESQTNLTWSAYRFHEEDPLQFSDGVKFQWRNGDMSDRAGIKCLIKSGGQPNGAPGPSLVRAYGWAYVWPSP